MRAPEPMLAIAAIVAMVLLWAAPSTLYADGGWVLWARKCDVRSRECAGPWQRSRNFDAERWCRAARTSAVDAELREAAPAGRGMSHEYQCLPEGAAEPGSADTKK
jgi:hypothetical protein